MAAKTKTNVTTALTTLPQGLWGNKFTEEGKAKLRKAAEERKIYPDFVGLDLRVEVAANNVAGTRPSSTASGTTVDKEALKVALKEKERTMPLCIAQCMTVGAPQTGKSSLKRRLLKQTNQSIKSTGVADKPVISAVTTDGSEWTVLEWKEEGAQFLQGIEQQPSKEETETNQLPSSSASIPIDPKGLKGSYLSRGKPSTVVKGPEQETARSVKVNTDSVPHQHAQSNSKNAAMKLDINVNEPELPSYSDLIDTVCAVGSKKWIAAKKRLENQCTIYFTDTGGQLEFQEVLPAIISGPSIFLLVFNLEHAAEGLDKEFPAVYKKSDGSVYKPPPGISTFTVRGSILHILASIQATRCYHFQKDGNDRVIEPKVLLVGTHSDCVADTSVQSRIESDIQDLLKDTPYYQKGMLQVPCRKQQEEKFVYMVNNESSEDPVFKEIRDNVRSLIFKRSGDSDYKEDIPAHWLGFDLMLRWPGKHKILTYQHCVNLGNKCNIKEDVIKQALTFLHERFGIIRYFEGEGLGDVVITNPQVIYDMISDLIAGKFNDSDSNCKLTPEQVQEFQEKGLISVDAVKCITDQRNETHGLVPFLLRLLSHLHIVVELEGDEGTKYFMPCVLAGTIHDLSKPQDNSEPLVADLLIVFDHGRQYCPKGLFSVLVIKLAQKPKQHDANYTWVINCEKLGRERVVFHINVKDPRCRYTLHIQHGLLGSRGVLRIFIERLRDRSCVQLFCNNLHSVCKEIRDSVENAIHSSLQELHKSTKFNIGFYSVCDKSQNSHSSHIAIIEDVFQQHSGVPQEMTCIDCGNDDYPLKKEHNVWFKEVPQQLYRDLRSEDHPTLEELMKFRGRERKINIPQEIGIKYFQFGIFLLEDTYGTRIENMELKYKSDPERINQAILQEWTKGRGKQPVSWETLIEALNDIKLSILASEIEVVKTESVTSL